jgi:hypothetical protein
LWLRGRPIARVAAHGDADSGLPRQAGNGRKGVDALTPLSQRVGRGHLVTIQALSFLRSLTPLLLRVQTVED